MLKTLIVLLGVSYVSALTDDELALFETTGDVEWNTGIAGWVDVEVIDRRTKMYMITSNGIPDHDTATFPSTGLPNEIVEQDLKFRIPAEPTVAETPGCLPMGSVGVAVNGVAIFNLYNHLLEDAGQVCTTSPGVASPGFRRDGSLKEEDIIYLQEESFDMCNGHPSGRGTYHYHIQPICLLDRNQIGQQTLLGVALDGYPIYGPTDENGDTLTVVDLDVCNGRYDADGNYKYHSVEMFPYIIGCFRGEIIQRVVDDCHYACNTVGTDKDSNLSFCTDV